jgi:hypothetical protein
MGQIANCKYISDAINAVKPGAVNADSRLTVANTEYLLKMIDLANEGSTNYGTGSFATQQIVDKAAVDDAVARLITKAFNKDYDALYGVIDSQQNMPLLIASKTSGYRLSTYPNNTYANCQPRIADIVTVVSSNGGDWRDQLFKSIDNGATWSQLFSGVGTYLFKGNAIAVKPNSEDIYFINAIGSPHVFCRYNATTGQVQNLVTLAANQGNRSVQGNARVQYFVEDNVFICLYTTTSNYASTSTNTCYLAIIDGTTLGIIYEDIFSQSSRTNMAYPTRFTKRPGYKQYFSANDYPADQGKGDPFMVGIDLTNRASPVIKTFKTTTALPVTEINYNQGWTIGAVGQYNFVKLQTLNATTSVMIAVRLTSLDWTNGTVVVDNTLNFANTLHPKCMLYVRRLNKFYYMGGAPLALYSFPDSAALNLAAVAKTSEFANITNVEQHTYSAVYPSWSEE